MATIQEIQANVRENLKYFINDDDNFETIINKIIQKLNDNGISIKNKGYEILDFKENFSKVSFKIAVSFQSESIEENEVLIINNVNFINSVVSNYKKAIELYLINTLELPLDKFVSISSSGDEKITKNQLSFLRDKMENPDIESMVERYLNENRIDSLEKLTKKSASAILDKIQSRERRNKRY